MPDTAHEMTRLMVRPLRRRWRSARILSWIIVALPAASVAGCSDSEVQQGTQQSQSSETPSHHQLKWLELNSTITPEQWLASRHEPHLRPQNDPEVERIAALLDDAHRLYRESTRIIANRAVQVEEALKPHGIQEPASALLADLATLAGEVGQTEGFGAVCQHYLNMRIKGLDRSTVIATLKDRYGKRQ